MRYATLVDKKRGVRDDIKYTLTNLKIIRLGIARTHGWVKLTPTVQTSSSHRSLTVNGLQAHLVQTFLLAFTDLLNDATSFSLEGVSALISSLNSNPQGS